MEPPQEFPEPPLTAGGPLLPPAVDSLLLFSSVAAAFCHLSEKLGGMGVSAYLQLAVLMHFSQFGFCHDLIWVLAQCVPCSFGPKRPRLTSRQPEA